MGSAVSYRTVTAEEMAEEAETLTPRQRAELFTRTPGEVDDDQCFANASTYFHRWQLDNRSTGAVFHVAGRCLICGVRRVFVLHAPGEDSE